MVEAGGWRVPADQRAARWLGRAVRRIVLWWRRDDYAPHSLGDTYVKVYRAIERRRLVHGALHRSPVLFCPHALGLRNAEPYVLGYQVSGAFAPPGSRDVPLRGWRWIRVSDLEEVQILDGAWSSDAGPRPALDNFEAQIQAG